MPLGPADEFLTHQTSETFDHVATSDRNFYDRYYFNMHASSDELFVIIGLGQYPNLGVTDAFITVSIGEEQHTVRASRELGVDRLDTTVGPLSVEVLEGLKRLHVRCEPNDWGIDADLTFDGAVAALEEPRTFTRRYGRVIMDVTRYAQVGTWEGRLTAAGRTFDVTPDRWKGARDRSWGVRPVGEPEAPGIRARQAQEGYGFRHDWLPMQFDDHMLKIQIDQDENGHRHVEEAARVWNLDQNRPIEELGRPEVVIDYQPGTREMRSATVTTTDPEGKPITVHNTPLRTLYLAAGSGYVNDGTWGHGVYQGPLKVEGVVHDLSDPEVRRRYAILNETLCRFELETGEVGYGMHENMLVGVYRPSGFMTADAVAP
ncbi:MAG TPA: hypothetical protein VFC99_17055 [Acidimicrobiia bacterium]|nr:hypothetical protein [Acidimicrobiia bacterium]